LFCKKLTKNEKMRRCITPSGKKTPIQRTLEMLRAESPYLMGSVGSRSEAGTPYSHVTSVDEPEDQKDVYRIATYNNAEAAVVTVYPKIANVEPDYLKVENLKNVWVPPTQGIYGLVTKELYDECYRIYENNQAYIFEALTVDAIEYDKLVHMARTLEEWFLCIVEPCDGDQDWYFNEVVKKQQTGFTRHCIVRLKELIGSVRDEIRHYVRYLHQGLNICL